MSNSSAGDPGGTTQVAPHGPGCDQHEEFGCPAPIPSRNGDPCGSRTKINPPGCLPVCGKHSKTLIPDGRCQAIADCGAPCGRRSRHRWGYVFCASHKDGDASIGSHLLDMPVELRLMVYRHLLPAEIHANYDRREYPDKHIMQLLLLNRKISAEAHGVFYNETLFHARVVGDNLRILGKLWPNGRDLSINQVLPDSTLSLIKTVQISVVIRSMQDLSIEPRVLSDNVTVPEDLALYKTRAVLQKFSDVFRGKQLTRVVVATKFTEDESMWHTKEELIPAILTTIEPLRTLSAVTFNLSPSILRTFRWGTSHENWSGAVAKLQEDWKVIIQTPPDPYAKDANNHMNDNVVQEAYNLFVSSVKKMHLKAMSSNIPRLEFAFEDIELACHVARIAYENKDLDGIKYVRFLLGRRFALVHGDILRTLEETVDTIRPLYDDKFTTRDVDPRKLFPHAFESQLVPTSSLNAMVVSSIAGAILFITIAS